jgi:hypothetical protein
LYFGLCCLIFAVVGFDHHLTLSWASCLVTFFLCSFSESRFCAQASRRIHASAGQASLSLYASAGQVPYHDLFASLSWSCAAKIFAVAGGSEATDFFR